MTARSGLVELSAPRRGAYVLIAIVVPLLLIAIVVGLRAEAGHSETLRAAAARSYDRRLQQVDLLSRLKDAETAQRGYLITQDPRFLEPYSPAKRDLVQARAKLLATPDPELPADYLPAVFRLVDAKLAELDRTITLARTGQVAEARATLRRGEGKAIMDRLRALIGQAIDREGRRSAVRRAAFIAERQQQETMILGGSILFTLLLLGFLIWLWRLRRARYAALTDAIEAARRNETILDSTIDALVILNPSGTVETINAAATALLGYSATELDRRDISAIIDIAPGEGSFHDRVGLVDGQLRRSFLTDRLARHRDGREIAVDVALGVMHLPSGNHIVASLRDIAERKRIERVKDDLISTVSHELRTPLTSVVGSLGLLRAGSAGTFSEDAGRLIEIAENNSRRLIRLINDMLDIDRIESGMLALAHDPIDLRLVIEQACTGGQGLASERNVRLECALPDQPVMVAGDSDRLVQVVTNLLSNAIRYAPEGSVVAIGLTVGGDQRATVSVDDSGPGIPLGFRDRIFGRFERAPNESTSTGTGLGLAISREIIARHDGSIWFEDRPGGGTRFAFALALMNTVADRDGHAPRILVGQHDEHIAAALIAIVINEGCAYTLVRSVVEARAALAVDGFAALLIDLNLPEEGGLALAREVRERDPLAEPPIIVVSPRGGSGESTFPALDVIDWLDNPEDADRLSDAVRAALSRSASERPVVLHLDDDRDLLAVVSAALEPEIRTVAVTDIASARALLDHVTPDAVIIDLRLAEGSGVDLIPFLIDSEGLAIPTIIYSAQDVAGDLAAKVDAVLVKARGSIPDLKATVRRVVRIRNERKGAGHGA